MMKTRRGFLVSALVVSGIVMAACGYSPSTETSVVTTQPAMTETLPINDTPVVSETPFVVVTPTAEATSTPESGEYAEIDFRIREFLYSEAAFTDDALADLPHVGFSREILFEGNYIGLMRIVSWKGKEPFRDSEDFLNSDIVQAYFQGIYLGGVKNQDRIVMFMGMKDKSGHRFIVPIGRTVFPNDGDTLINMLTISEYDSNSKSIDSGFKNLGFFASKFSQLSDKTGQVAVFDCIVTPISGFTKDIVISSYGNKGQLKLDEFDNSVPLCRKLFNSVEDVRGKGDQPLAGADENFPLYNKHNYIGIMDIVENIESDIAYDMIIFVRP